MASPNPPPRYTVHKTATAPSLTGRPDGPSWQPAQWSRPFQDLVTASTNVPYTAVKMLYDDHHLYIAAQLLDKHVCATITQPNSVIFMDNDFELFLDPDGDAANYYELEINAFGTTWQLSLDKPYSQGGSANSPHQLPGLKSSVFVDGKINDPTVEDTAWYVTLALPFEDLRQFGASVPPNKGDVWRMNFSRVHWQQNIVDGRYQRIPPHGTPLPQGADQWHPEQNIVWAPTGILDIHLPAKWGFVVFDD